VQAGLFPWGQGQASYPTGVCLSGLSARSLANPGRCGAGQPL